MIAYCGLNCSQCQVYVITQKDDDIGRKRLAKLWARLFNTEIDPQQVNCDGCLTSKGRLFITCSVCDIRKCAHTKKLKNCVACDYYCCEKLESWCKVLPGAKSTLDREWSRIQSEVASTKKGKENKSRRKKG